MVLGHSAEGGLGDAMSVWSLQLHIFKYNATKLVQLMVWVTADGLDYNDEHKQFKPFKGNYTTPVEVQDSVPGGPGCGKVKHHQPLYLRYLWRQLACTIDLMQRPTIGIDFISQNIFL